MKKKKQLLVASHRLPYNPKLKERAKILRKDMTEAEKLLWQNVLKNKKFHGFRFLRQRPIDMYIVDFYCPELCLVIEIDGEIHKNRKEYDEKRTSILRSYDLQVIRFSNNEVLLDTHFVKTSLENFIHSFPLMEGD